MSGLHVTPNGEGKVRNSKYSVVLCSVGVTQAMLKKGAKCLTATQICDTLRLCGCAPCGCVAVHRAVVWLCTVRLCGCASCGCVAVHRAVVWLCTVRLCGCAPCGCVAVHRAGKT